MRSDKHDHRRSAASISRRKTLVGLCSLGVLGSLSGLASAEGDDSNKPDPDPDGDFDIEISNGSSRVVVGELEFDEFDFNGNETLFSGGYGLQEADGDIEFTYAGDGSVVSTYPSTGNPGQSYTATIDFSLQDAGGNPQGTVSVERIVTLDSTDPLCTIEYCITNTGSGSLSDLNLYQFVDYDVDDTTSNVGEYVTSPFEYVYQTDPENDIYAGFNGETVSENHDVEPYFDDVAEPIDEYNDPDISGSGPTEPLSNTDMFPSSGTDDVGVALQWGLGRLAAGATTCFTVSFASAESQEGLESLLPSLERRTDNSDGESDGGDGDDGRSRDNRSGSGGGSSGGGRRDRGRYEEYDRRRSNRRGR